MATPLTFLAWAESLETLDYYDILRVERRATTKDIQSAFHAMSLRCHPDRFVEEDPEVSAAAASVFKRLVEAYNVLRRPALRKRYDAELAKGEQRIDVHAAPEKKTFEQRTLLMIAKDPKAKRLAAKADVLLGEGRLDEARIQLIGACQADPFNAELKERLDILYEALMLEPGGP